MVKSKTELLRRELEKLGFELLDIYSFKESDLVRVRHKHSSSVVVYETKKKVSSLVSVDDARALALEIAKKAGVAKQ